MIANCELDTTHSTLQLAIFWSLLKCIKWNEPFFSFSVPCRAFGARKIFWFDSQLIMITVLCRNAHGSLYKVVLGLCNQFITVKRFVNGKIYWLCLTLFFSLFLSCSITPLRLLLVYLLVKSIKSIGCSMLTLHRL